MLICVCPCLVRSCRFCRDVFCDSCTDYRLLTKDPKDRSVTISARACRSCFDACKGRKRRNPVQPTPKPRSAQQMNNNTAPLPPKTTPREKAAYYVKRQPSTAKLTSTTATITPLPPASTTTTTLPSSTSTTLAPSSTTTISTTTTTTSSTTASSLPPLDTSTSALPIPTPALDTDSEQEEEDEDDDEASEGADEVIIEDDEEFDYEFPIPSPSPRHPTIHPDPTADSIKSPLGLTGAKVMGTEGKWVDGAESQKAKDEFERGGDDREGSAAVAMTPREAELMAIPADALASVRHGAGGPMVGMPVVRSEESYEERNVEKRFIVPPSPVTGVQHLMNLASPSTVPQPLLNALNSPSVTPDRVADVVTELEAAEGSSGVRQPSARPVFTPRTSSLLEKAATKPPAPTPSVVVETPPPATAPPQMMTPSQAVPEVPKASAAEVVEAVLVGAQPTQEKQATVTATATASPQLPEVKETVMESVKEVVQEVKAQVSSFTFQAADDLQGMGSEGQRFVSKRRRVVRQPHPLAQLLQPMPLALLGLGVLFLFAFLPLSVSITLNVLVLSALLLYTHLFGSQVPSAPLSVSRDFPDLAAEHASLVKERQLTQWETAEQRMDGLAALPSPSLTKAYASQTEELVEEAAPAPAPASASAQVMEAPRQQPAVLGGHVAPRPRPKMVI